MQYLLDTSEANRNQFCGATGGVGDNQRSVRGTHKGVWGTGNTTRRRCRTVGWLWCRPAGAQQRVPSRRSTGAGFLVSPGGGVVSRVGGSPRVPGDGPIPSTKTSQFLCTKFGTKNIGVVKNNNPGINFLIQIYHHNFFNISIPKSLHGFFFSLGKYFWF